MTGLVKWIGIRSTRKAPLLAKSEVYADRESGLTGDHDAQPHRQVTLISYEALKDVAATLGVLSVDPANTRRNILIADLDFDLNPGAQIRIGEAVVEVTGPCLPCSRMDETLGEGGRAAMAHAGGLTARILESGNIAVGDRVEAMT